MSKPNKVPVEKVLEKVYNRIYDKAIEAQEQGFASYTSYPKTEKDYLEIEVFLYAERVKEYLKSSFYKKIIFFFPCLSNTFKLGKAIGKMDNIELRELNNGY